MSDDFSPSTKQRRKRGEPMLNEDEYDFNLDDGATHAVPHKLSNGVYGERAVVTPERIRCSVIFVQVLFPQFF